MHGMLCSGAGCVQLCAPSLFQQTAWSATPSSQVGIFLFTQPANRFGITLSPPHRLFYSPDSIFDLPA
jgi:hypothetical protein